MPTDRENIMNAYFDILEEVMQKNEKIVQVKRIDKRMIMFDQDLMVGDTVVAKAGEKKNITDFLQQITYGGGEMITVWATRRRDKKENGVVVAKAGDEYVSNGKLGACEKDISGVGSPLGGPQERFTNYDLITMCVNREGEFGTRHIGVDGITKIKAGFTTYVIN